MLDALYGYRSTCMLITMIELDLPSKIGMQGISVDALAEGHHKPSLFSFLQALAALDIVFIDSSHVRLTDAGLSLLDNTFMQSLVKITQNQYLPAWSQLSHTIKYGEPGMTIAKGKFAWDHRAEDSLAGKEFIHYMEHIQKESAPEFVANYSFDDYELVADIGGGKGYLMLEIIKKNPHINGIIQDLPHVFPHMDTLFRSNQLIEKVSFYPHSFFEDVPTADVYILQYILHDWNDDKCLDLLRNIQAKANSGSKLLIMENLTSDPIKNLHMLLISEGKERTLDEMKTLLHSAGMNNFRVINKKMIEITL